MPLKANKTLQARTVLARICCITPCSKQHAVLPFSSSHVEHCRIRHLFSCCVCAGLVGAAVQAAAGYVDSCGWQQRPAAAATTGTGAPGQSASTLTLFVGTDIRQGGTQVGPSIAHLLAAPASQE